MPSGFPTGPPQNSWYDTEVPHHTVYVNSVFVIEAYRHAGTWAFTDKAKGLTDEPFVCGVPDIIDGVLKDKRCDRIQILFSERCFPGFNVKLKAVSDDCGGFWYSASFGPDDREDKRGWLCPATLNYFDSFPDTIYVSITAL